MHAPQYVNKRPELFRAFSGRLRIPPLLWEDLLASQDKGPEALLSNDAHALLSHDAHAPAWEGREGHMKV